jgi:hypothetical protein
MFYKVLSENRVVDVLNHLSYARYMANKKLVICPSSQAQVIVSSDETRCWHIRGLYAVPGQSSDPLELVEIDEYEYRQLKALNGKTPEEIIDEYTLFLIEEGLL